MTSINGDNPLAAICNRLFFPQQESKQSLKGVFRLNLFWRVVIPIVHWFRHERSQLPQQENF